MYVHKLSILVIDIHVLQSKYSNNIGVVVAKPESESLILQVFHVSILVSHHVNISHDVIFNNANDPKTIGAIVSCFITIVDSVKLFVLYELSYDITLTSYISLVQFGLKS